MEYKKIGVVIADKDEYLPFKAAVLKYSPAKLDYFDRDGLSFYIGKTEYLCVYSGVGKVNAAAATLFLIDRGAECVLNFGLSGGLSTACGSFILPQKFVEYDFDLSNIGYKLCEKPAQDYYIYETDKDIVGVFEKVLKIKSDGTAVTGDSFICDSAVADRLRNVFGATSCDMETAAIAAVCRMANKPFCALRRVSDNAGDNAVEIYRDMNLSDGDLLSGLFIKALEELSLN